MRNCNKGYSCGKTCINRERNCTKKLTGQSVELASTLASSINSNKPEKKSSISNDMEKLKKDFADQWMEYEYKQKDERSEDSAYVRRLFNGMLKNSAYANSDDFHGIYDSKGNLQGMVKISVYQTGRDSYESHIDEVMTAPWNTESNHPKKMRGAGTELILHAQKLAKGGPIHLEPLVSAIPFYEKLGFKKSDEGMTLDSNKTKKL